MREDREEHARTAARSSVCRTSPHRTWHPCFDHAAQAGDEQFAADDRRRPSTPRRRLVASCRKMNALPMRTLSVSGSRLRPISGELVEPPAHQPSSQSVTTPSEKMTRAGEPPRMPMAMQSGPRGAAAQVKAGSGCCSSIRRLRAEHRSQRQAELTQYETAGPQDPDDGRRGDKDGEEERRPRVVRECPRVGLPVRSPAEEWLDQAQAKRQTMSPPGRVGRTRTLWRVPLPVAVCLSPAPRGTFS